jgi:tetratricopeptide (TPR) repeat protein
MKKIIFLLIIANFLTLFVIAQNSQKSPELEEAENLNRQSGRLYALRQYDQALEIAFKELKLRQKIGDEKYIAAINFNIGGIYREKKDYRKAINYMETALTFYRRGYGENHEKVFNALNQTAHVLILQDEKTKAINMLKDAQLVAEKLFGKESRKVAEQYFTQAQVFSLMKRNKESDEAYQQGILINDQLLKSVVDDNRPDVDTYMCFLVRTYRFDDKWGDFNEKRTKLIGSNTGGIIVNGKATKLVSPNIPPRDKSYSESTILVRVIIDEEGNIIKARSLCFSSSQFINASVEAAYQSKFSPTQINGKPVRVSGLLIYKIRD